MFSSCQPPNVKLFINSRNSQTTSELYPVPLTFLVFQRELKDELSNEIQVSFITHEKCPKCSSHTYNHYHSHRKHSCGKEDGACQCNLLTGEPTSTLAKFQKDKYLQTSSIYLPVYLPWLLKIKILPRMRLPTFSVFVCPSHRKPQIIPIISIQPFPVSFQNKAPRAITHTKTKQFTKSNQFEKILSDKMTPFCLGNFTWQDTG